MTETEIRLRIVVAAWRSQRCKNHPRGINKQATMKLVTEYYCPDCFYFLRQKATINQK